PETHPAAPRGPDADAAPPAPPRHLPGMTSVELRTWLAGQGQAAYRADQILQWIYVRLVDSFDAMTNLSKPLRAWLGAHARLYRTRVVRQSDSADGTRKLLLACDDGASIETVWIPADGRNTACLSSQVG